MNEELTTGEITLTSPRALATRTAIGAGWLVLWRMVSRLLGLVSTLVLARILVPEDFGILAMATTFAAAIDALSQLGLQDALVRRVGDDKRLFDAAFTLQLGRALSMAAIIALGAPLAGWWFHEPRVGPVLLVLAAGTVVSGLENIGVAEIRRAMRYDIQFKLFSVPRLLQVAVTIPAAFLLHNYWALLVGILVSKVAQTVMTYVIHPFRPRLRLSGWRELASFSFWSWAACVAGLVWDRIDPFVMGRAVGTQQLGLYLLALELAILPTTELVGPAAEALFTAFAALQKGGTASVRHAPLVAASLVMGVAPLVITLSCASGDVVGALLGPNWRDAAPLISVMAWLCLFSPLSYVSGAVLVANGHVRRNFIGKAIASAIRLATVLVAISLTRRLDLIAASVTLCVCLESCAYMVLLKGLGSVRLRPMIGPALRTVLASGLVVLLLHSAGMAWQPVSVSGVWAFLEGLWIGIVALGSYAALILAFWLLAGRPDGPESRLLLFASGHARPIFLKLSKAIRAC